MNFKTIKKQFYNRKTKQILLPRSRVMGKIVQFITKAQNAAKSSEYKILFQ
jgi:hypothetical protein